MERRQLGRSGPSVPVLFLGTWPLGGGMGPVPRSDAISTIRCALEMGVSGIDTAEGYGDAEELIGAAVQPSERPDVFIATKVSFGPYTASRVREAAEQSLRRLRTDHLDLVQLHFYPADTSLAEALDALEALREAGLARYVGLSNFAGPQLDRALEHMVPQAVQVPLNLFDRDELAGSIARCRQHGIGVLCHSGLAKGLLTGRLTAMTSFATADERSRNPRFSGPAYATYLSVADGLREVAAEAGIGMVELAVAWVLAQAGVTACIAGPRTPDELVPQVRGVSTTLPDAIAARAVAIASAAPAIGHGTPTSSPPLPQAS